MKKTVRSLMLVVSFVVSSNANAEPVNTWEIGVSASFSNAIFTGVNGTSFSPTSMSWGTPVTAAGQSQLYLTDYNTTKSIATDGASQTNFGLTHLNNVINGNSLLSVNILTTLTLTALNPTGVSPNPSFSKTFNIKFFETANGGTEVNGVSYCPNGEKNGEGVNVRGCADIFTIDGTSFDQEFFYNTTGTGFGDTGGEKYYLSFFNQLGNLSPLTNEACTYVGAQVGCLGFMSPEQRANSTTFAAMVTSSPTQIPEPGTLALLGIALGGLALSRQRKQT